MSDSGKSRFFTVAVATLMALGGFIVVLWGVAWFLPRLLRYPDSPWIRGLPGVVFLFLPIVLLVVSLRKRRAKLPETRASRLNL